MAEQRAGGDDVRTLERGDIWFFSDPEWRRRTLGRWRMFRISFWSSAPRIASAIGSSSWAESASRIPSAQDVRASGASWTPWPTNHAPRPNGQRRDLSTRTRGGRFQPAARPAGEGVYRILRHGDHAHLVYSLKLPERPSDVQEELGIEHESSYVLSIKNPEESSPPQAGLPKRQTGDLPQHPLEIFSGRRFAAAADPPDFLNHEGMELILIFAGQDVESELHIALEDADETAFSAEIFSELKLQRSEHPVGPLLEGEWE